MFPHGESIILHRFAGETFNAHGQSFPSFEDEPVSGVALAPLGGSSPDDGITDRVDWDATIYVRPGLNIGPQDEVTARGERYRVAGGASGDWVNPYTGWTPGAAVKLRRVTG